MTKKRRTIRSCRKESKRKKDEDCYEEDMKENKIIVDMFLCLIN
jgi:hypothetical protein